MISRRAFLHGAALGAGSLALAACTPVATPSATSSTPASLKTATEPATPGPTATGFGGLPLRERIARLLVVGFRGLEVGDAPWLEEAIATGGLGGVILFDKDGRGGGPRNVASPDQVARLVTGLRGLATDRELIVAIDQEGGRVTRLSPDHGFPAVRSQQAVGEDGDDAVQTWADGLTSTLADAGINLNLAPVVDLNINPDNPSIGAIRRAFSADPAVVARDAEIAVTAHRSRGIRTTLKHFPGIGSATANTDFGVADVTSTWDRKELLPYRHLLDLGLVDAVMSAHVVNGQIDANAPASLSRATVTDLLRGELGWDGVVITDDLQAGAITDAFAAPDAIARALDAGNDLLLFANQQVYDPEIVSRTVDTIENLVLDDRLAEARIDESVTRISNLL